MYNGVKEILCTIIVSMLILGLAPIISVALCTDPPPTMYINPPSIVDTTIGPGDFFIVNASVLDITDLYNWQVQLQWDSSLLNCTRAWLPSDTVFAGMGAISPSPDVNNEAGSALIGSGLLTPPGINVTEGVLCQFNFTVERRGHCDLTVGDRSHLKDSSMVQIPGVVFENGYFDNRLPPSEAAVYVDPPKIINLTLLPCESFSINISIIDADLLYSFEFKLYYNTEILNATNVELGDLLPPDVVPTKEINRTAGYVWFNASLYPREMVIEGNGTLATITFHVEGLGESNLILYDTALADSGGEPLPHSTSDGYFNNILMAKLNIIPVELIDPSLTPSSNFTIDVAVDDVENMYGYEFNLAYDTNILTCIGLIIHSPLGETHFSPDFSVNDTSGLVWVKVNYYPPANPIITSTNETLITLIFRVDAYGCTVLDLHNTTITDPDGKLISHKAHDGFFCTLIRDVAVIDVEPSSNYVYEGWIVNVTVTVRNEGNLTETFNVTAYYDDNLIGSIVVEDLAPEEERIIEFIWDTTDVAACHNYTISAEAAAVPYEVDLDDNILEDGTVKIRILGDVDGDGAVDMTDIGLICLAYGSTPSHERWNPDADLNHDGIVDMTDIGLACLNFGRPC